MVTGPVSIPGRYWETVERLKINQFYGAPTAIRLLLRYGDEWVKKYDRSSLKVLGSGNCWWHELTGAANPWAVPLPINAKSSSTWKQKGGRLLFGDGSVSRPWETVSLT